MNLIAASMLMVDLRCLFHIAMSLLFYQIIIIFTALKYEIELFSAPIINVYSPCFRSVDGINSNETSFSSPSFIEIDDSCSKYPVEFPIFPDEVNVPEATNRILLLKEDEAKSDSDIIEKNR
jgi:hypothetical protein